MKPIYKKYSYVPDLCDQRDYMYQEHGDKVANLPRKVDLRPQCSPIKNQGSIGSCTGNSIAGATEFAFRKDGKKTDDLSRLFIYYQERASEGTISQDSGAQIRDGIKAIATYGIPPESVWPYDTAKFTKKPSVKAYKAAVPNKVTKYLRVVTKDDMLNALASGYTFVLGFTVYESFESEEVAKTGVVPMPSPDEKSLGGHAVYCVGYDLDKNVFIVANSWGTGWGDQGYFYIPIEYLTNTNLAEDFWCIQ